MHLFIVALWSAAGKGLTSWLSFVMSNCEFVTFPIGILGQVWYSIVSNPDLYLLSYFILPVCMCVYQVGLCSVIVAFPGNIDLFCFSTTFSLFCFTFSHIIAQ